MSNFTLQVFLETSIGNGEDSHLVYPAPDSRGFTFGVFDGLGGRSAGFDGLTGGQIASREASRVVREFLQQSNGYLDKDGSKRIQSLICNSLKEQATAKMPKSRLSGTLAGKRLCTTVALASVCLHGQASHTVQLAWMGDSRIYFLSPTKGLQQMTADDLEVGKDAFEMIREDPPMSKFLTADVPQAWYMNYAFDALDESGCILACTDGCFQYLPTPWDFERLLLETLAESTSPAEWEKALCEKYEQIKGDDISLLLRTLGFEGFESIKESYRDRLQYLRSLSDSYSNTSEELLRIWNEYRPNYEARLRASAVDLQEVESKIEERKAVASSPVQSQVGVAQAPRDVEKDFKGESRETGSSSQSQLSVTKASEDFKSQSNARIQPELQIPKVSPKLAPTSGTSGYERGGWENASKEGNDDIPDLLREAEKFIRYNTPQKAREIYKKILDLDPNNIEANFKLGDLYLKSEDVSDVSSAITHLQKSCVDPNHPHYFQSYEALAQAYYRDRKYQAAIKCFEIFKPKLLDLKESSLVIYAFSLLESYQFPDAFTVGEKIRDKYPENYYSYFVIGLALSSYDCYDDLIQAEQQLRHSEQLCRQRYSKQGRPDHLHKVREMIKDELKKIQQKLDTWTHTYGGM